VWDGSNLTPRLEKDWFMMKLFFYLILPIIIVSSGCQQQSRPDLAKYAGWREYGGGLENIRYSSLVQINRDNVHLLDQAWIFDTGDAFEGSQMQYNPIMVNGVLYVTSPKVNVIALKADTGEMIWRFDPHQGTEVNRRFRLRGVTYWEDENGNGRIFTVVDNLLYALDAKSGRPISSFGQNGWIDLRDDLSRDVQGLTMTATSPGVIYKDMLIIGSQVGEDLPTPPGHIRAYDVRTGKLCWRFNTIPHPGEYGYETWPSDAWIWAGAANSWAGLSVDTERGLVFAPTGSAAYDYYGGNRPGDNLFANSLIALNAETGERVWHFQFVRHDIWDRDLPSPPVLVQIERDGRLIDAVAQATKGGHLFVFERETGEPVFPIEYRAVPQSTIPGEVLADTQPFPLLPPPFARQKLTEEDVTRRTPEAHQAALEDLRSVKSDGPFTPLSFEGTVVFPGLDGGAEWGGQAFDPETKIFYVNANEIPWIVKVIERPQSRKPGTDSRDLYLAHCASCHRPDFQGSPPEIPALSNLKDRLNEEQMQKIISAGTGRMAAFGHLGQENIDALTDYLIHGENREVDVSQLPPLATHLPYSQQYRKFMDIDGYPAITPPWGTLTAINLETAEIVWQIPLGEIPELVEQGVRNTGSENYGGPVVTAGGLVFIAATNHDNKIRAFDKANGDLLWEATLPAAGNATPAVYEVEGRQFIVIAAGGGKSGRPSGGAYVAFALPQDSE